MDDFYARSLNEQCAVMVKLLEITVGTEVRSLEELAASRGVSTKTLWKMLCEAAGITPCNPPRRLLDRSVAEH